MVFFLLIGILLEHVSKTISNLFTEARRKQQVYYICLCVIIAIAISR